MTPPRKRSEAPPQKKRPAAKHDSKAQHATPEGLSKPLVNIDRDNEGCAALAIELGVYDGMTRCIARHVGRGPHVAIHQHPVPVSGLAVVLVLFGGFSSEADNGWMLMSSEAVPGAGDYLMGFARCLIEGEAKTFCMAAGEAKK